MNLDNISHDYLDDVLIRMSYHSSAIEGNTISLAETVSIILESTISTSSKGYSVREFYEIENHRQAFAYLLSLLKDNTPFHLIIVKEFHALLMDRLYHNKRHFKSEQNAIVGADFETATPFETPQLMNQWVDNTLYRLNLVNSQQELCEVLAESHIQFQRIHPFADGNGRTGRILLMYLAMRYGYAPIVVKVEQRAEYIRFLSEQNGQGLADMFSASITFEEKRITQF